jgi:hypothetical protein
MGKTKIRTTKNKTADPQAMLAAAMMPKNKERIKRSVRKKTERNFIYPGVIFKHYKYILPIVDVQIFRVKNNWMLDTGFWILDYCFNQPFLAVG